jgi:hypothetical protein
MFMISYEIKKKKKKFIKFIQMYQSNNYYITILIMICLTTVHITNNK